MKKLLLLFLLVAGGVSTASAWDNVYLNDDDNKWGSGDGSFSQYFYRVDADNFYYDLTPTKLNRVRNGNYYFRFFVSNNGGHFRPANNNDLITATDYSSCVSGEDNMSFKIFDANAKSVRINLSYNDGDGSYKWHLTATITDYSDNTTICYVNNITSLGTTVYAYVWDPNNSNLSILGSFPGKIMDANADGTYSLTGVNYVDGMKVIFNNKADGTNGTETSSIEMEENAVYNFNGIVPDQDVSISSFGNATFCSAYPLDFSNIDGLVAYRITNNIRTTGELIKDPVTKVPANTGLYIEGNPGNTYRVSPTATATSIGTNMLVGTVSGITGLTQTSGESDEYTNYILTVNKADGTTASEPKFFKVNIGGNDVPANKAYLQIPTADAAREFFWFEGATSIESVKQNQTMDGEVYNLAGQRVAQPTNGLYIVNGKKVIMK